MPALPAVSVITDSMPPLGPLVDPPLLVYPPLEPLLLMITGALVYPPL